MWKSKSVHIQELHKGTLRGGESDPDVSKKFELLFFYCFKEGFVLIDLDQDLFICFLGHVINFFRFRHFLQNYPCAVNFIQHFIQDIDSNFTKSFNFWIRTDDAYFVGEIYTLSDLNVYFFAGKGLLSAFLGWYRRFSFYIDNNRYWHSCITQTTAERYYCTVLKNHTTSISMQTWVTETVNHHSTYSDLFTGCHLLTSCKWMLHDL